MFLAGPYGLAYNADKVKTAPDSWEILWSDEARNTYSVNAETAFVNVYISAWVEQPVDPTIVYDIDRVNTVTLQQRLDRLADGAKHFWSGFGNTPEQLETLHYTATWGFGISAANKAGQHWKLANPKEGVSIWVDGISLTKQASEIRKKSKHFMSSPTF